MTLQFRQRLLSSTLLIGVSALATPAYAAAQPATPQPTDAKPTDVQANPTGPVEGQPTPSTNAQGAPTGSGPGGNIIVTGTRIPQPNLTSAAPVTVVSSQDLKLQGTTRVEDMLNSLPSVTASQSSGVSNGSNGTATVNLRNLGAKRTLVLVNGRRLVPGDAQPGGAGPSDINVIPSSIVKRVEVLTGGASSVYGADAVAGVVNFIMDDNFSGIRFDGQYSFNQHNNNDIKFANGQTMRGILDARIAAGLTGFSYPKGSVADGGTFDGTVSFGTGFDDNRGHAVAYFGYRKVNPVLQSRRDYSACVIQTNDPSGNGFTPGSPLRCGGSATASPGNVLFFTSGPSSTAGSFGPGVLNQGALNRFNFGPTNYFQRADERYVGGAFAHYDITPAIKPYMEFMFMDDRSIQQIAAGGDFLGSTFTVNCDNPLLSAQQASLLCNPGNLIVGFLGTFPVPVNAGFNTIGTTPLPFFDAQGTQYNLAFAEIGRRNTEGGPRITDYKHTTFRGVVGMRGDLGPAWSYDSYFQYGRTNVTAVNTGNFATSRLNRALNVVTDNRPGSPTFGQPICRSVLDGTDPLCVPYDIFTGAPVNAAQQTYLSVPSLLTGVTGEQVADVNFTGALGEMGVQTPWADEGVGVNFGAEYRKESLSLVPDAGLQAGDQAGNGAPTLPIDGNYRVLEAFGEVQIPLIRHSFIEELSINAGYRKSWYKVSNGGTYDTDTYKISAEFAPIKDIRFRGAYNRAARAPNIQELFTTNFVGLDGGTDPCTGAPITATQYGCIAQLTAAGIPTPVGFTVTANPAGQYNGLLGGNPGLQPEKATTKTLGVVVQPRMIPRLALTVDWYKISIDNAIQTFGADAILAQCVAGSTATTIDPSCALVHRNPAGSLWLSSSGFVTDIVHNVGSFSTEGIDVSGSYSYRLGGIGTLSASYLGTFLRHLQVNNGLTATFDCAGFYGTTCSVIGGSTGSANPKYRHKARLGLQMPNGLGASVQWRHFSSAAEDFLNPVSPPGGPAYTALGVLPAQDYFDLALTATVGDHYNFRLGVNNILDRAPPLTNQGSSQFGQAPCPTGPCNGNTYPGTYDALGRYIYAGVTLNF